jgi:cobalt-zinc-cadmium resistance protein CzcA
VPDAPEARPAPPPAAGHADVATSAPSWLARLVGLAMRRLGLVLALAAVLVAAGLLAFLRLPFDAFPDLTGVRVEVITPAPGFAVEEVEQLVTYPVESAVMGLEGADAVRSTSKAGLSLVTITFADGTDLYHARTIVAQRLADAKGNLPPGAEPALGPVTTPLGELYQYVVESDSLSLTELKTLHDYTIRPRLRSVPGVSEVNSWGGLIEQVQVSVDPAALAAHALTLDEVHDALADNSVAFGGAYVETGGERWTLRGLGRVSGAEDIRAVVIRAVDGVPLRVADVATVEVGALPRFGAVSRDGEREAVAGMVLKRKGEDSRRVIAAVLARLDEVRATLPPGVTITPFYDQSALITRTTHTILKNLALGGLLVVAVLFLFLRDVRASLLVASVIPLSMLIAFAAMWATGSSANLMSLGALDFGLLVDGAIVMVDQFVRQYEGPRGAALAALPPAERRERLRRAAVAVARPVLFGVSIIVAVYLPIFTLGGMEGRMFRPMAFTVVVAVLGSLLLALTFVPAVAARVLAPEARAPFPLLDRLTDAYGRALEVTLAHPRRVVALAVGLVAGALAVLRTTGTEFMPRLDEGAILVNTRQLPSTSLAEAMHLARAAERIVRRFPEATLAVTKQGRPDLATEAMGLFEGDLYVPLRPRAEWTTARTREGLVAAFDSALAVIPGLDIAFTQPMAMRLDEAESGIKTDLGVKVFGSDLDVIHATAERIRDVVARVPGAADVTMEVAEGAGQLRITPRREALAAYGLTVADLQAVTDLAGARRTAAELVLGPRRVPVAVTLAAAARSDLTALARLPLRAPDGALVPLGAVAELAATEGPELVGHEQAQRRTLVVANVRGRDLGGFAAEVQRRVAAEVTLPRGVFLEWGGQFENQQRAMQRLELVLPLAIGLIVLLLYAAFRSWAQAVLVLANVPFALVGGVAALWALGLNLSLSASIGFIALFGIAVLNGVVLVEHLNHLRDAGEPLETRVRDGARDRLRPVLMTALVASLGFVPMAISTGAGAEVQRPLASVVIGGLFTSTLLTLLVLPVLYRALARWQEGRPGRIASGARRM